MKPGNILKIESLNEDWEDKDYVLLHACFQLLKDFVEKENPNEHTDWDADEMHRNAKREIDELYNWWLSHECATPQDKVAYEKENEMLVRLIKIRWAMWT